MVPKTRHSNKKRQNEKRKEIKGMRKRKRTGS